MASTPDATFKESEVTPSYFLYMRRSHPQWTHSFPTWNGRYSHLLASTSIKIDEFSRKAPSFFIEAKGYDRQLLAQLIPSLSPNVRKIGFNGTKLLVHLYNESHDSPQSSCSSDSTENFESRFPRCIKGLPILFPTTTPEDVAEISDEKDLQIQGHHLLQFHHLCRKVQQAFKKRKPKQAILLVGPLVDRYLAKVLIRSMDPEISPILPHRSPDGMVVFTRRRVEENTYHLRFDLPFMPRFVSEDEDRQTQLGEMRKKFISRTSFLKAVECVIQNLYFVPPKLEQLYAIARDFFVRSQEGENLLQSPILIFPFRVFLKSLYHELTIIDEDMREKNAQLQALIHTLKQLLLKKGAAMQTLPDFLAFFETISDKEIQKLLIEICGGRKFLSKLKKFKKLGLIKSEAAQIHQILSLTFEIFHKNVAEVTRNITPKKVVRSIFPDRHPLWQITINGVPFTSDTDNQSLYLQILIKEISLNFRDGKKRSSEDETQRLLEGVQVNERIDTAFRNGRVIRKMDSDAFPLLQKMTIEAWGPADSLLRKKLPLVFSRFHLRRKKSQSQLCNIEVKSPASHQIVHQFAYVLYEQLSPLSTGLPYVTIVLEWTMQTPSFQGKLKITDFAFTPELESQKNAPELKQQIFSTFFGS